MPSSGAFGLSAWSCMLGPEENRLGVHPRQRDRRRTRCSSHPYAGGAGSSDDTSDRWQNPAADRRWTWPRFCWRRLQCSSPSRRRNWARNLRGAECRDPGRRAKEAFEVRTSYPHPRRPHDPRAASSIWLVLSSTNYRPRGRRSSAQSPPEGVHHTWFAPVGHRAAPPVRVRAVAGLELRALGLARPHTE